MMLRPITAALALSLLIAAAAPAAATTPACAGSCNSDDEVTVDEILTMVNIALGAASADQCADGDVDASGGITVDEILIAINNALEGCGLPTGDLGTRRFELDPQRSSLKAVLAPGFELTLGTFRGQTNGQETAPFLSLQAGTPDPETGLASVSVTESSEYFYAGAQIAGIVFCLKPILPAANAGVIDCDGGLDFSIATLVDHVVGQVGQDGFDIAACVAANGEIEGPNQICAAGLSGAECFVNADCDTTTGSGDGLCGLATGLCSSGGLFGDSRPCNSEDDCEGTETCRPVRCTAGKEGEPCRNAGDCDTEGMEDGLCGVQAPHPGACNGPLSINQIGGDSGAGATIIAPQPSLGLSGLPAELSIESALPCGDEGPGQPQPFAMTTGIARTSILNFSGDAQDLVFEQSGENLSCSNWENGTGGRFVLGFPTLHLNPMSGGDLVVGFTFQGK
ncbi:MAG TPA: hypothetical protein VEB21_15595 [Terriglobales bacterium]|nr:hypothetical protein [Terriglobales bacterium]